MGDPFEKQGIVGPFSPVSHKLADGGFVGGDVLDDLAVDLKPAGNVEGDRDFLPLENLDVLLVLDVFPLDDAREHHERAELTLAMDDDARQKAASTFLVRGDVHAAAIKAPIHRASKIDFIESLGDPIDRDRGFSRFERPEEEFEGDARIIDVFGAFLLQAFRLDAAIPVDAEADAVDETIGLAFHLDGREANDVFVEGDELRFGVLAVGNIVEEVISGADGTE